ncbi:hypothetical protein D3C81_1256140 [compost metagenome]
MPMPFAEPRPSINFKTLVPVSMPEPAPLVGSKIMATLVPALQLIFMSKFSTLSVPLPFGAVAVPMSLIDTSPMFTEMVLSLPAPSTEQASLLMVPVKLIVPLPALVGTTGSAARTLPAAKIDRARSVRDSVFMLLFHWWG